MKYLDYNEIQEESIIAIDLVAGDSIFYYVHRKREGNVSGATLLLGYKISELLQSPNLYPCFTTGTTDRYYVGNEGFTGRDRRVKGYRQLE